MMLLAVIKCTASWKNLAGSGKTNHTITSDLAVTLLDTYPKERKVFLTKGLEQKCSHSFVLNSLTLETVATFIERKVDK